MTVEVTILRDDGALQCSREYEETVSENEDVGDRVAEVRATPRVS